MPAADRNDSPPFGFLCEAEEEKLSQLLGGERPQTVALVLSHLPPARAGEVLARFAPPLQVEVVRRLVDLENADPETLREVEQALETRLAAAVRHRAQPHGRAENRRAESLPPVRRHVAGRILDNLAQFDPSRWPSSSVAGRWSSTTLPNSTMRRYGPSFGPPSRKWRCLAPVGHAAAAGRADPGRHECSEERKACAASWIVPGRSD